MYMEFDVPKAAVTPNDFGGYWLATMFLAPPPDRFEIRALTTTYMRLVQAALVEYDAGVASLMAYWDSNRAIAIGALQRASSHFESCISTMLRAINCFRKLRSDNAGATVTAIVRSESAQFARDDIWTRVREVRNAIHHLEEKLIGGELSEGQPFFLFPDGPERQHPSEADQTIKRIDRLRMADYELKFSDLVTWLNEMGRFAIKIAHRANDAAIAGANATTEKPANLIEFRTEVRL
ncbi:hypothetical protein [Burkholderia gladioli]|uniref:hypothetical protein n=1 Tax=Burkholderia gladioli TaxID=28095 RepID=UPI00164170ED|nr:hypothetical protein [Burkholderia gladioli]